MDMPPAPRPIIQIARLSCLAIGMFTATLPCTSQGAPAIPSDHAQRMEMGMRLFRDHVRGTLEKHCLECHKGAKPKGDFDLTTREKLAASGMVGATADDSQLIAVISHDADPHMPWKRERLAEAEIQQIRAWVDLGAPYDRPLAGTEAGPKVIRDSDREFWSFRPLNQVRVPIAHDRSWPQSTIDQFILGQLEQAQLAPQPWAPRATLARRAFLDLWGIPPSPQELAEFVHDPAPNAYPRLIDRLLAHPRYGERWARYWLDVARFAESGGFEHDSDRPQAFHYRDFVIRALNQDLPFDDFVRWQLAGDEFAPDNPLALAATGFLVAGVFPSQLTETEFERTRYDQLDDMISTCGVAFLGMTIGCARCHDHKYDPITAEDYYRFAANFTHTIPAIVDTNWQGQPGLRPHGPDEVCLKLWIASEGLPPISHHANDRGYPHLYAPTYYLRRGDPHQKDHPVEPGVLQVLLPPDQSAMPWRESPPIGCRTSYHRRNLANWMVDTSQGAGALTARVIANRVWQHHFGQGIVNTPNDFGLQGDRPSHPELLDWLASELIRHDWHLKALHKTIMTSSTYMQRSSFHPNGATIDPENRLYWRFPYQRMDAESLRDSTLEVCGRLDTRMYGPGSLDPASSRRSIYFVVKRSQMLASMQLFDMPEPLVSIGSRARTTIAPQALLLLNGSEIQRASAALATQLLPTSDTPLATIVTNAYLAVLGREPTRAEIEAHTEAMEQDLRELSQNLRPGDNIDSPRRQATAGLIQLLLSLNEFIYVE